MMHASRSALIEPEITDAPGSRPCQVNVSVSEVPILSAGQAQAVMQPCPNKAEALIWFGCPNGHEFTEEVCRAHIAPPEEENHCGLCMTAGELVGITVVFVGWL
jgi:hypothetical protein